MNHQEELVGTVDRFFFQSLDTGFSVFVLTTRNNQETVVRGYIPNIQPGAYVHLSGTWVFHPKFGKQFDAQQCSSSLPTSCVGLKKYLGSGLIRGIGPVYAEKMVTMFGENILEIIEHEPERLQAIDGIGKKRIELIADAWQEQKSIANVMVFLQDKGITTAYATKIFKKYGDSSIAKITENPYRLAEEVWGIGFKTADQIAQKLGIPAHSQERIQAGILFAITDRVSHNGHLYGEVEDIKKNTLKLLCLDALPASETAPLLKKALYELYTREKIKLISNSLEGTQEHYITLSRYFFTEKSTAQIIKKLVSHPSPHTFDFTSIYASLRVNQAKEVQLNEKQQEGILSCLQHKITVITGGPGTGKTTLIKKLLTLLEQHNLRYRLAAPTGRAAKRITEGTGRHATTIHRLLGFDAQTMGFVHNEQNALELDMLIVDEASMIDIFLGHALIKALPQQAHLVLIGDSDQLPSVGPGNLLNDLIESNFVASIRLHEIFRQAQDSLIIVNAHRINTGLFPSSKMDGSRQDYRYINEQEPEQVAEHLKKIMSRTLPSYGIAPHDAIVLTPMNRGCIGTHALNYILQKIRNPATTEKHISWHGSLFKPGDPVMQLRNNYDKNVFNGDIGSIHDINLVDRTLLVQFGTTIITYEFSELDELALAYAITIHKSQGSEYPAVIIPMFTQHFTLLQRNLLYTAVTRAKKLCIVIGQTKALAIALRTNKGITRKTFLREFLTTDLTCR